LPVYPPASLFTKEFLVSISEHAYRTLLGDPPIETVSFRIPNENREALKFWKNQVIIKVLSIAWLFLLLRCLTLLLTPLFHSPRHFCKGWSFPSPLSSLSCSIDAVHVGYESLQTGCKAYGEAGWRAGPCSCDGKRSYEFRSRKCRREKERQEKCRNQDRSS